MVDNSKSEQLVDTLNKPIHHILKSCGNLYSNINSYKTRKSSSDSIIDNKKQLNTFLNILSYADGKHNILDIANITNYNIENIATVLDLCLTNKLVKYPK